MGNRPRIVPVNAQPVLPDALQYNRNHCTEQARRVLNHFEHFEMEVWFDKHYYTRAQLGDESGKREGIDSECVKCLVLKAIKHLYYYAHILDSFSFLNFPNQTKRLFRILLKDNCPGELPLNVIVEFHWIDLTRHEATIKTALRGDDFRLAEGQHMVELYDENASVLSRKTSCGMKQVYFLS
jgi:hypothetical protein